MRKKGHKEQLGESPELEPTLIKLSKEEFFVILYENLKNLNLSAVTSNALAQQLEVLAKYDEELKKIGGVSPEYYFSPESFNFKIVPIISELGFYRPLAADELLGGVFVEVDEANAGDQDEEDLVGFERIDKNDFNLKIIEAFNRLSGMGSAIGAAMGELSGLIEEIGTALDNDLVVQYFINAQTGALSVEVVRPRPMGFVTP